MRDDTEEQIRETLKAIETFFRELTTTVRVFREELQKDAEFKGRGRGGR